MLVFGGKVTGKSHRNKDIPCQDSFFFDKTETGEIIIAVADGLGSAASSDIGSGIAVNTAAETIRSFFDYDSDYEMQKASLMKNRDIITEAFLSAERALQDYASEHDIPIRDLACTLLVAFSCNGYVTTGQIGDGAITAQIDGDIEIISDPGDSEYLNEVTPITSGNIKEKLRINENIPDVEILAIFTDGCQRAFLEKKNGDYTPFEPFFRPFFSYARDLSDENEASEEIEKFLGSEKMDDNSEDDKTLVIAVLQRSGMA